MNFEVVPRPVCLQVVVQFYVYMHVLSNILKFELPSR